MRNLQVNAGAATWRGVDVMCIYHKKDQVFMGLSLYWPLETEMPNQGSMEQQSEKKKRKRVILGLLLQLRALLNPWQTLHDFSLIIKTINHHSTGKSAARSAGSWWMNSLRNSLSPLKLHGEESHHQETAKRPFGLGSNTAVLRDDGTFTVRRSGPPRSKRIAASTQRAIAHRALRDHLLSELSPAA